MTTGSTVVRVVMGALGVLMLLGGLALALSGFPGVIVAAIWLIPSGIVLIVIALIEVSRYRSQEAERSNIQPGPGGGETDQPGPPFARTEEVFIDPTSQRKMRVYMNPGTGERRYVAEG